ncbi:hypothetical protein FGG08_007036 [Glutinoglossum americanum]|uniref:chitin synthase n=1 Tax=Glutinoglossum americanum TaxID=1670608 RepID=A0A9P8I038_9PEZI|nr:hypothetical protein FGG08_007036 [Glutinoglossum americanum]
MGMQSARPAAVAGVGDPPRTQVSTATLLSGVHAAYAAAQPYRLDDGTSVVANTWRTASSPTPEGRFGGTVDRELARRAWEHARRRAEDGCVVLESLHASTPSLLVPFLSCLPPAIPSTVYKALEALRPFLEAVSPQNPSTSRYSSLAVTLTLSLEGAIKGASISLSSSGIDTNKGLLNIPCEAGYRAFDVFYYLLTCASSPAEREFLGLSDPSSYDLLKRSGTYNPPSYLLAADDAASADDLKCSLREIGIKGSSLRNLWSILAGLLKLGNTLSILAESEHIQEICEDVGGILCVDPETLVRCSSYEREALIGGLYEALVDWIIVQANKAIAAELSCTDESDSLSQHGDSRPGASATNQDTVALTIVDVPDTTVGRAMALRDVFDNSIGILAEMAGDGVGVPSLSASVLNEVQAAVREAAADLGIPGDATQVRLHDKDRRQAILEKIGEDAEAGSLLKEITSPTRGDSNVDTVGRLKLSTTASTSRLWHHLSIHPTHESPSELASLPSTTSSWSSGTVSSQLRLWRLPEWANRRNRVLDFTADFDIDEFCTRYAPLGCEPGKDGIESWILQRGWSNGAVVVGHERVWVRECAWWEAEGMLDLKPELGATSGTIGDIGGGYFAPMPGTSGPITGSSIPIPSGDNNFPAERNSHVLGTTTEINHSPIAARPTAMTKGAVSLHREVDEPFRLHIDDGDFYRDYDPKLLTEPISTSRRLWVILTWTLTFWIPSPILSYIGRMKRPDVRMAWREKVTIVFLISVVNAAMVYTMIRVGHYALLAFAIAFSCIRGVKTISAIAGSESSRRRPDPQDRFVVCLVPVYTEGESLIRASLDSLTTLQYDNKRKLICVICDGITVGNENDRPTPKIVLDTLGVDPKIDPPALPFKSVGRGNEQLNYGKVYSGLYEYEGNVVPYLVVVKVGKESEQPKAKPGHRGKRDSQVLLLNFLNRVHHRSAMSPLELEMFHQINNIIGVDPELYEYLLMVDADTRVSEDSLNRLVACCTRDSKVAGICGETVLGNEERSWWTMIQVYEYYTSYHLTKTFESVFGSVTCLPGCFCMYRLRTADKGRPLIISDKILSEYSDGDVDTLHKKNLLSLGEDRYLTTLMMKHFPHMSYKFTALARASTTGPERLSILLSQRRRWINSAIHNLAQLAMLKDLCGCCCFSMRFVVFFDLLGTIILPATATSLGYLFYKVAKRSGLPALISLIMVAATYALQAMVFIIKGQWQFVGWMIIYLLAFPIYSILLPIYSFWNQDNFSWGDTRIVLGEKGFKKVVALDDEGFDPASIPLQTWNDHSAANGLPGRRDFPENGYRGGYEDNAVDAVEMDDIRSIYSSVRPGSTILAGFPAQSPSFVLPRPPGALWDNPVQQSPYPDFTPYNGPESQNQHGLSMADTNFLRTGIPRLPAGLDSPTPLTPRIQSPASFPSSQPMNTADFQQDRGGPDDAMITEAIRSCLAEADLDSVTKKQVRALVEQKLQTELVGERRTFLDRQIDAELTNM